MEELLTLKAMLLEGDIGGALTIVEELTEISRDDKINAIASYGVILLLNLIKQKAENRTTRSWEVSIRNAVLEIQKKNKRRLTGGVYLQPDELHLALEEAYPVALKRASLEVDEGRYEPDELEQMFEQEDILIQAMALILPLSQSR